MPETGGYQSAKQMYTLTTELLGEDNVSLIFLAMPKRSIRRVRSFLRVLKEERAHNAEGFIELSTKAERFNYWYKFFSFRSVFCINLKKLNVKYKFNPFKYQNIFIFKIKSQFIYIIKFKRKTLKRQFKLF
jgi:hypothetical protein